MGATLSFVTGDSQPPDPDEQMPGGPGNRSPLRDGDRAETVRMRERARQWVEPECPSPGRYRRTEWGTTLQNDPGRSGSRVPA
ncbi:hypothetical protein GCM10010464_88110 [Pseudonocardia yunnanensis]